jgi:hypothetical protein
MLQTRWIKQWKTWCRNCYGDSWSHLYVKLITKLLIRAFLSDFCKLARVKLLRCTLELYLDWQTVCTHNDGWHGDPFCQCIRLLLNYVKKCAVLEMVWFYRQMFILICFMRIALPRLGKTCLALMNTCSVMIAVVRLLNFWSPLDQSNLVWTTVSAWPSVCCNSVTNMQGQSTYKALPITKDLITSSKQSPELDKRPVLTYFCFQS